MVLAAVAFIAPLHALTFDFSAEWRLIAAGTIRMSWKPSAGEATAGHGGLEIKTGGMVGKLYPVHDLYTVALAPGFCATKAELTIQEGNRRRQTTATFADRKARFEERDLVKNTSAQAEVDVPVCVHDVVGGLLALRKMKMEPGARLTIPVSDGKRFGNVDVHVLGRESVKTPAGVFSALRCEVFLMNGVVYQRSGRLFVWISEDEKRLPVQIQVRLQLLIGTITLRLVKEES